MVRLLITLALFGFTNTAGAEHVYSVPQRVVSINLCTDQLAMLIAAPGQLASVSWLAADPSVSLMVDEAKTIGLNHSGAEEVFLQDPELVLADPYSDRATVNLMSQLGLHIVTIPPTNSIKDLRENIIRMGKVLGQPKRAERILTQFDADLAAVIRPEHSRLATTYGANGYAADRNGLAGDVMRRAGLQLLSGDLSLPTGQIPLESLIMAAPGLIITGDRYPGQSQSEAILDHPAFRKISATKIKVADRDWICGLPSVTSVIARLTK